MQAEPNRDYKRTTVEQLQFFVGYINDHPELLANKNDPTDPERVKNLWAKVAASLNSLNGPTRSGTKWKETLSHWKNQLRSRARKIKVDRITTGGGPPSNLKFKDYEERALEVFGAITVDGVPGVPTLGSEQINIEIPVNPSQENYEESDYPTEFLDSYLLREPTADLFEPAALPSPPKRKRNKDTSSSDLLNQILQMTKARDKWERKTQEENLRVQTVMAEALKRIAENLQSLSEAIKDISKTH